jgi:toxin ParE1/3/4
MSFAQQGKQQDFMDTIESALFRIVGLPEHLLIIAGQIRRYLTLKFSYAVLYRAYPDRIVIAAIMSCRRDPN